MTLFDVDLITHKADFLDLAGEWNDLLERSEQPTIFLTWEWLSAWYQFIFNKDQKLWLVVVRHRQTKKLVAIAPLMLQPRKVVIGVTLTELCFLGAGSGADHLDFILDHQYQQELEILLTEFISSQEKSWDLIHLEGGRQYAVAYRVLQALGHTAYSYPIICPYLQLPSRWDDYLKTLGKKRRYKIGAYRRKLEAAFPGQVTYQCVQTKQELDDSVSDLFSLHQQAQQAQGRKGAFAEQKRQMFHQQICQQFLKNGWLRLYFLRVEQKPIAMVYSFFYHGVVSFYTTGFDLQWSAQSPGQQIIYYVLEQMINEQAQEFDFLRGDEDYKFMMTKTVREDQRFIVPQNMSGRLLAWAFKQKKNLRSSS